MGMEGSTFWKVLPSSFIDGPLIRNNLWTDDIMILTQFHNDRTINVDFLLTVVEK